MKGDLGYAYNFGRTQMPCWPLLNSLVGCDISLAVYFYFLLPANLDSIMNEIFNLIPHVSRRKACEVESWSAVQKQLILNEACSL